MISGFDDRFITLIEAHPSIIVGTCDRALLPTMSRGFGARVVGRGAAVEVLVSEWPGRRARANIEPAARIAVTFTVPETFEAYQVKGRVSGTADCTPEDLDLVASYTETIRKRIQSIGEPEEMLRVTFFPRGLYRVSLIPEEIFRQTPGKHAGQRL